MQEIHTGETASAKPFLKWAGGKAQLLPEIRRFYPFGPSVTKYAEPFVGGGAVLFDILNRYPLSEVYISDINPQLINAYQVIRDDVDRLAALLRQYQEEYVPLDQAARKRCYLEKRERFNRLKAGGPGQPVEAAALMIFLNRTCFNGLYRVNRKGLFNVPMGAYRNPVICNEENLRLISQRLRRVAIVCGDYRQSAEFIDESTFVYLDPPYRPLTSTSSFTAYAETAFDDRAQTELFGFVEEMDRRGAKILLSNSDPKNVNREDDFFDALYASYRVKRVEAARMINSKREARGKIKELLISNFPEGAPSGARPSVPAGLDG